MDQMLGAKSLDCEANIHARMQELRLHQSERLGLHRIACAIFFKAGYENGGQNLVRTASSSGSRAAIVCSAQEIS